MHELSTWNSELAASGQSHNKWTAEPGQEQQLPLEIDENMKRVEERERGRESAPAAGFHI